VSFYNQTGDVAIHPTPVVGVLGVMDDVATRTSTGFRTDGSSVFLLGTTRDELDGSEWAHVVHGHLGGRPPIHDLGHEQRLAGVLVEAGRQGYLDAAHDLSDGGLAQALCESVLRHGVGVKVALEDVHEDPFVALFSESAGRVLVSVVPGNEDELLALVEAAGLPVARIGTVDTDVDGLVVSLGRDDRIEADLVTLRHRYTGTLPAVLGR
jgi:phosphoribosylformylglycinamidine synthase